MRGSGLCEARVSAPPTGAPHAVVGSGQVERCCLWTWTVQGFASRVGCPDGGQRCLGEVGRGRGGITEGGVLLS